MSKRNNNNAVKNIDAREVNDVIGKADEVVQEVKIEQVEEANNTAISDSYVDAKIKDKKDSKDNANEGSAVFQKKSTQNQSESSIESTIKCLESVINNYRALNQKIHENKSKIAELQRKTIKIKDNKLKIEKKVHHSDDEYNKADGTSGNGSKSEKGINSIANSNLVKEITDNKYFIKNKTCNNIKKNVEKIQNNIASDTKKSASYIEPLYLSCKLLKTHISYTQSLENTVAAFDIQKELELQQDDANELIKMLVDHFDAIKDYQPLTKIDADQQDDQSNENETHQSKEVKQQNEQDTIDIDKTSDDLPNTTAVEPNNSDKQAALSSTPSADTQQTMSERA